jgi:hypothetical protein
MVYSIFWAFLYSFVPVLPNSVATRYMWAIDFFQYSGVKITSGTSIKYIQDLEELAQNKKVKYFINSFKILITY